MKRRMLRIKAIWRPIALWLALTFMFPPSLIAQATRRAEQSPPTAEEITEKLDGIFTYVDRLVDEVDTTKFDLTAKAKALNGDPTLIFEFVRDEIRYEPYHGVLRGAEGTLMTGAGNAADQSMLLHSLLQASGHKAQFVLGKLDIAKARTLLPQIFEKHNPPPQEEVDIEPALVLASEMGVSAAEAQRVLTAINEKTVAAGKRVRGHIEKNTAKLSALLKESGIELGAAVSLDELASEAVAHYWIRYKSKDGKWIDLDPSFRASTSGTTNVANGQAMDALPDEVFHKLTVISTLRTEPIGNKDGKDFTDHTLLEATFRTADLAVTPIEYTNVPDPMPSFGAAQENFPDDFKAKKEAAAFKQKCVSSIKKGLLEIKEFTAVISSGSTNVTGKSFGLDGIVTDEPREGKKNIKQVQEAGWNALSSALSTADKPEDEVKRRITGHWLTFRLDMPAQPGQPTATSEYKRHIIRPFKVTDWKPDGPAEAPADTPDELELVSSLFQTQEFIVPTGRTPIEYFEARQLRALAGMRPVFEFMAFESAGLKPKPIPEDELTPDARFQDLLAHMYSTDTADEYFRASLFPNTGLYRSLPAITTWKLCFEPTPDGQVNFVRRIDIIDNPMRAVARATTSKKENPAELLMMCGIVETAMEYFAPRGGAEQKCKLWRNAGATTTLHAATDSGVSFVVIDAEQSSLERLAKLDISPAIKTQIADDIANGYIVAAPEVMVARRGGSAYAWWRIDPKTGKTLGMIPGPAGQSGGEDITTRLIAQIDARQKLEAAALLHKKWRVFIGILAFLACMVNADFGKPVVNVGACILVGVGAALDAGTGSTFAAGVAANKGAIIASVVGILVGIYNSAAD